MPQARAEVMRRRNSSMRASVRATSMPPQVVLTPSAWYWRWLSRVSIAISRLWSVGKMKFEAWPVEPRAGQRPLVDEQQVAPTELRQMSDQAVADDAGADHGDACPRRRSAPDRAAIVEHLHSHLPVVHDDTGPPAVPR